MWYELRYQYGIGTNLIWHRESCECLQCPTSNHVDYNVISEQTQRLIDSAAVGDFGQLLEVQQMFLFGFVHTELPVGHGSSRRFSA